MARRPTALAVALLTAAVLTGCGSDGDPSAFADATDQTCQDVTAAISTLQRDLVRGAGTTEARAVKAAIDRYATTVSESAKQLAARPADKPDVSFQRVAAAKLREHADGLREAGASIDGGRLSAAQVRKLLASSTPSMPAIPAKLLSAAPACEVAAR